MFFFYTYNCYNVLIEPITFGCTHANVYTSYISTFDDVYTFTFIAYMDSPFKAVVINEVTWGYIHVRVRALQTSMLARSKTR